ncbi:MAG: hypothetical protein KBA95_05310 [Acidobacteria bacterium]|nr:hypothetical protein [Acidobacteriota bacterium]
MRSIALVLMASALTMAPQGHAGEAVAVRYPEGPLNERLVLRAPGGSLLAEGEMSQAVEGALVTTRVVFHFNDGSLHDETVVFSQDRELRFVRDRLVQRGPAFPRSIDMSVDGAGGQVTVAYSEGSGQAKHVEREYEIPANLANGMVPVVLKNLGPDRPWPELSLIVATPSPRLVRLEVKSATADRVAPVQNGEERPATHYVLKAEIGGVAGFFAPLVGRQPPDSHVWIAGGNPPIYLRSDQPFYVGGPLWRMEVAGD